MRSSRAVEIVSGLTTLGALALITLVTCEWPPSLNWRLHAAIGRTMAQQALSLLGKGGQITVIARDTVAFKQPAADFQLDSFKREVRRGGAKIAAAQLIQVDPLRPLEAPPGDFFELIRNAPSGSVIVSFMGPPLLTEEQRSQLSVIKPRIVAFCSGNLSDYIDLRALFDQQLLHAAVVSRRLSSAANLDPKMPAASFDQLYTVVTAANLSGLPTPLSPTR
jgi:hypothetical protein